VELWITNDTLSRVTDTVWLGTRAGEKIWEDSCQVEIGPNDSRLVWSWGACRIEGGTIVISGRYSSNGHFPPKRQFFRVIKDLRRNLAQPEADLMQDGDYRLSVHLLLPSTRTSCT
jgi:hypothetical protein